MKRKAMRVIGKHNADCFALKNARAGTWPHAWCFERVYFGNFAGTAGVRGNFHLWARFRCNDTLCRAEMIAKMDYLLAPSSLGPQYKNKRGRPE